MLGQFYPGQAYPGQGTADSYTYTPTVAPGGAPLGGYNELPYNSLVYTTSQTSPTTVLNTADLTSFNTATPTVEFTATDAEANDVRYNIQISENNAFSSTSDIAFDAVTVTNTTLTYSHTVSGTDRLLIVTAGIRDTTLDEITGITYAGAAMTKADGRNRSGGLVDVRSELWYLVAPATGTNNVVITGSAGFTRISTSAMSYTGVDQTSPIEAQGWAEGLSSPASASATSLTAGAWAVNSVVSRDTTASTPGTGETERADTSAGTSHRHIAGHKGPVSPGSVTMQPTVGADDWVAIVVILKPSTTTASFDKVSGTDAGFLNTITGGDTDPFNSGEKASYTVQSALTNGTYYWRVRALDPSGTNYYGSWSATRSFTVTSSSSVNSNFLLFFN